MVEELITLVTIVFLSFLCPIIASIIPRHSVPETVLLLIAGMVAGPSVLGFIQTNDSIQLLSDLGLGFLFLLAGYDIDPKVLTGHQGRRGLITWFITLGLAFLSVVLWPTGNPNESPLSIEALAITIALTTTAIGTLLPIMEERGIMGTPEGQSVLSYGIWGELCPVLAMTLLLTARAEWVTVTILLIFIAIAVLMAVVPRRARVAGRFIFTFIHDNASTNAQMIVRTVLVLLVALTTISAVFDLDIVLGAFAAGFILRYVIPEGSPLMEEKLKSMAFGFFIPLFFIVSGALIDPSAIISQPTLLVVFIFMLVLIRAVPILVSLQIDKETRTMPLRNKFSVALYCTTALPIIVAVMSVATSSGAMSSAMASVFIAAGGITVLIMPFLGMVIIRTIDAELPQAIRTMRENPGHAMDILRRHRKLELLRHEAQKAKETHAYGIYRTHVDKKIRGAEAGTDLEPHVYKVPLDIALQRELIYQDDREAEEDKELRIEEREEKQEERTSDL